MSKLAKKPIHLNGVNVEISPQEILFTFNGKQMKVKIHDGFIAKTTENVIEISPETPEIMNDSSRRKFLGTMISLTRNAVEGLKNGFKKIINLEGVGYKAILEPNNKLCLNVGYSHLVYVPIPEGVEVKLESLKKIAIISIDKAAAGDFAAKLSKLKRYNPYTGNGILIEGKFYIRKEVKKK